MSTTLPTAPVLQFEVVRHLTIPFLIIPDDGTPFYLRFDSEIAPDTSTFSERVRKSKKNEDGSPVSEKPMDLAKVTDLQSGQQYRLVLHDVLKNTMLEDYKDGSYVGKVFKILKTRAKGKRYFSFDVTEIRLKTPAPAPAAPVASQETRKR